MASVSLRVCWEGPSGGAQEPHVGPITLDFAIPSSNIRALEPVQSSLRQNLRLFCERRDSRQELHRGSYDSLWLRVDELARLSIVVALDQPSRRRPMMLERVTLISVSYRPSILPQPGDCLCLVIGAMGSDLTRFVARLEPDAEAAASNPCPSLEMTDVERDAEEDAFNARMAALAELPHIANRTLAALILRLRQQSSLPR